MNKLVLLQNWFKVHISASCMGFPFFLFYFCLFPTQLFKGDGRDLVSISVFIGDWLHYYFCVPILAF